MTVSVEFNKAILREGEAIRPEGNTIVVHSNRAIQVAPREGAAALVREEGDNLTVYHPRGVTVKLKPAL